MNGMQRLHRHGGRTARSINDTARALEKAMARAGIPDRDRPAFLDWAVGSLWDTFKDKRMNERIMIEDEIRGLGIRLPNGTVSKEYIAEFTLPAGKISNIRLSGAEAAGLSLEMKEGGECRISGIPSQAGDFTLILSYDTVEGEPSSELRMPVAFNPDPRKLWRPIKTDSDIPYYKPDSEQEYIKVEAGIDGTPRKDIVAASQRGRSHAQEGKPRDDHFGVCHCEESDWYIIAVADGAGSAKFSRKGSEVACKAVIDYCREKLEDNPGFEAAIRAYQADAGNTDKRTEATRQVIDIIYNGARKAHEAVKKVAETNGEAKLKDFATTLMFAICRKFDFGWFIASFWVGDGAMCLYNEADRTAKLLGSPDEGEFSGQTRFLTMPEIFHDKDIVSKRLRMAIVPDFTALFLMTDGVSDPLFETDNNLNDYAHWEEFYHRLRSGFPEDNIEGVDLSDDNEDASGQLLKWLDFWSPGNHDDRTLAILC